MKTKEKDRHAQKLIHLINNYPFLIRAGHCATEVHALALKTSHSCLEEILYTQMVTGPSCEKTQAGAAWGLEGLHRAQLSEMVHEDCVKSLTNKQRSKREVKNTPCKKKKKKDLEV